MDIKVKDGSIIITIPFKEADIKAAPITESGKSKMLASTKGYMQVEGAPAGVKLGLNLISAIPKADRKKS